MTTVPFPFSGQPRDLDMRPLSLFARQAVALLTPLRILASLVTGTPSMEELTQEVNTRQRSLGRKFSKDEAGYNPVFVVPPLGWEYTCRQCRFFQPETSTCSVVGLSSDPWGGAAIGSLAWCAYWLPLEGQALLSWVPEVLTGQR